MRHIKTLALFSLPFALASLFALSACKKNQAAKPQPKRQRAKAKPSTTPSKNTGAWAVKAYEVVRKALAADDLAAAKAGASAMAKAAASKAAKVSSAAKTLAEAKDIAAARLAFGELSKHTITLLAAGKAQTGLTAYQCPMAKGYKKWLQADADMANPYMGKRMLKCGGKTKFTP